MVFASTSVLVVDRAPKNGRRQCLCPQGELQLPPASLGGSPRSASGSDPGSSQITASALGPGTCEILCVPFKGGVSISPSPLALLKLSPLAFKAKCSGGLSSWHSTPRLGSLMWHLDTLLLWENLCSCNYSPLCGLPAWRGRGGGGYWS